MTYSDDKGATWSQDNQACFAPPADHQTLVAAKPRVLPVTPLYSKIVYYCDNQLATTSCARSLDGGTVYLPRDFCNQPYVAVTRDDGTSWTAVKVSKMFTNGGSDPAVAVDKAGVVYCTFVGADGRLYLTISKDEMSKATWDGFLAIVDTRGNATAPSLTTIRINNLTDPLVRGHCGPGRCDNPGITDFFDVAVDKDGRPWVALVDGCIDKCAEPGGTEKDSTSAAGIVFTLAQGPGLRDTHPTLPPIHPAGS